MAQEELRVLKLNEVEHGVVIRALDDLRQGLDEKPDEKKRVEAILLKIIDAPRRRMGRGRDEAR